MLNRYFSIIFMHICLHCLQCDPEPEPGEFFENQCTADPAMMVIPPLEQYGADYTFLTPTVAMPEIHEDYKFHWLMVVINSSYVDGLMIDNNITSYQGVEWEPIPESSRSSHGLVGVSC